MLETFASLPSRWHGNTSVETKTDIMCKFVAFADQFDSPRSSELANRDLFHRFAFRA
jgi:hypothetical protein